MCQTSWYIGAFKDRSELAQLGGCENGTRMDMNGFECG